MPLHLLWTHSFTASTRWRCCGQHCGRLRSSNVTSSCWHGALYFPRQPSLLWVWRYTNLGCSRWAPGHQRREAPPAHQCGTYTRALPAPGWRVVMVRTEPWCTPTSTTPTTTANSSLYWPLTRWRLRALMYMSWMTGAAHLVTPRLLHRTFRGTRPKAFSDEGNVGQFVNGEQWR